MNENHSNKELVEATNDMTAAGGIIVTRDNIPNIQTRMEWYFSLNKLTGYHTIFDMTFKEAYNRLGKEEYIQGKVIDTGYNLSLIESDHEKTKVVIIEEASTPSLQLEWLTQIGANWDTTKIPVKINDVVLFDHYGRMVILQASRYEAEGRITYIKFITITKK